MPILHLNAPRRFKVHTALALCVTLLAACGNRPAPSATYVLLNGSTTSTEQQKGKVTLVNFWATSCVSCVAEMPELAKLHQRFQAKGFDTLAVAMQYDPPSYVVNFAETRKLPFSVAIDNTGSNARAWGNVAITPTSFLLNKRGDIVKTYVGTPNFEQLSALVEKLLLEG